jgi:quercetin dioxygenase-like cupin family protein
MIPAMADVTVKRFEDMEGLYRGSMRKVRAELGLSSFGVQTIDLPPDFEHYPWHDHAAEGQEELYIVLRGGGWLEVEGADRIELVAGETAVRVGPSTRRRVLPGAEGMRLLVVGGVPGRAYAAKDFTELGAPDFAG